MTAHCVARLSCGVIATFFHNFRFWVQVSGKWRLPVAVPLGNISTIRTKYENGATGKLLLLKLFFLTALRNQLIGRVFVILKLMRRNCFKCHGVISFCFVTV